jgi:predicted  nucleic acid-binding Zn-ribbon protein
VDFFFLCVFAVPVIIAVSAMFFEHRRKMFELGLRLNRDQEEVSALQQQVSQMQSQQKALQDEINRLTIELDGPRALELRERRDL